MMPWSHQKDSFAPPISIATPECHTNILPFQTEQEQLASRVGRALSRKYSTQRKVVELPGGLDEAGLGLLCHAVDGWLNRRLEDLLEHHQVTFLAEDALDYPTSAGEVTAWWEAERTLVVQNLQMAPGVFNIVCAEIALETGMKVACGCYISRSGFKSFEYHTDGWDSVLVQLVGMKRLTFRSRASDVVMRPGDVVLMSAGVWHRASADRSSIHLSISLRSSD